MDPILTLPTAASTESSGHRVGVALVIICGEELESFLPPAKQRFFESRAPPHSARECRFLGSLGSSLYRMALFLLKAGSPSWDVSSLNQLWDLVDAADFLVGLCAPKKRSPSFNAPVD